MSRQIIAQLAEAQVSDLFDVLHTLFILAMVFAFVIIRVKAET